MRFFRDLDLLDGAYIDGTDCYKQYLSEFRRVNDNVVPSVGREDVDLAPNGYRIDFIIIARKTSKLFDGAGHWAVEAMVVLWTQPETGHRTIFKSFTEMGIHD